MNDDLELQSLSAHSPRWLDRLADGELTSDQQRKLLIALEAEPDGWRRCAMAFIEAQSWRQELRGFPMASEPRPAIVHTKPALPVWNGRLRWFCVAASLLLAFTLGAGARGLWLDQNSGSQLAQQTPAPLPNEQLAANAETGAPEKTGSGNRTPWQALKVTMPSSDGQPDQTVEVPLVEGNQQKLTSLLANQSPVLSEMARQTLESTGHEVAEHRAYYPVKLDDGRQAVLPMDYVEVHYIGGWQ
jgi:hypothetical protein